jgi:nucleobindin
MQSIYCLQDDMEHQAKADAIVNKLLEIIDRNKDGSISPEELETVGLDALPNFEELGAEGHHYDVESGT